MTTFVLRAKAMYLPDGIRAASLWVKAGRIERIGTLAEPGDGRSELDAGDYAVMPGLVDTHVHINDPGRASWEGFATATRAAAAGGVTTLVDMPLNSVPATVDGKGVEAKLRALEGNGFVDVGFCGGLVPGNATSLDALVREGVLAVKCFLCESGVAEFPHVVESQLLEGMRHLSGVPLFVHAELPDPLERAEAALGPLQPGEQRTYARWLASRPMEAEEAAVELVLGVAERTGARAHVVHLSASSALPLLRRARDRNVMLSAETCPHYLTFASEEIPDGATAYKCAPPIRESFNRDLLWDAVREGLLTQVVTDHSPSTLDLKCNDSGDFVRAWGGISSLELGFTVLANQIAARQLPLHTLLARMTAAPAELVGLTGRKGALVAGADADFFFWDPNAIRRVIATELQHRNPITPYEGRTLQGRVVRTYLRGREIYRLEGETPTFASASGSWLRGRG